jgi:hypothetical protein
MGWGWGGRLCLHVGFSVREQLVFVLHVAFRDSNPQRGVLFFFNDQVLDPKRLRQQDEQNG